LTVAQALVRFLSAQKVERDGREHRFFEGCFGIFGHGNVTGIGQALAEKPELLTYYQARNEQAMVHTGPGYDLYYLNVMAGPHRRWLVTTDPDHRWQVD
jgi:3D-(3,5/4)-trihydroxycyclohexane-1,2-dione acylhydrolase (decyclizing)